MEVREEELCTICQQLRRCILLVPTIPNLRLCMVCLADAMEQLYVARDGEAIVLDSN